MAITRPDEYQHNNPSNAIVDSDGVRGGARVVVDLTALYALVDKKDQLKEHVTIVTVLDSDGLGTIADYKLIDATLIDAPEGWQANSAPVNGYIVNANATGFPQENASIDLQGGLLTVRNYDGNASTTHFGSGGFYTEYDITNGATQISSVNLNVDNGVLDILSNVGINLGSSFVRLNHVPTQLTDLVRLQDTLKYKAVADYATMIADGTPITLTRYKVAVDSNKSNATNTIYEWWPDGKRIFITSTADN